MKTLHILYDVDCAFCVRCRNWLAAEPAFIPLNFIPKHLPEVKEWFPGIEAYQTDGELVAVSDDGAVYQGPNAFIICLYALKEYRAWSLRLAQPALLPFARKAMELLSDHRQVISRWMGKQDDQQLAQTLKLNMPLECESGKCNAKTG